MPFLTKSFVQQNSDFVHKGLDQLVHSINESSYKKITYDGWKVINITWWETSSMELKIREVDITYSAWQVNNIITKQYNESGILVETYTETIVYSGSNVDYIEGVLT